MNIMIGLGLFGAVNYGWAETVTKSLTVSATISSGCALGISSSSSNDFGTLDFGKMTTIEKSVDVASSIGAGSIIITCTPGVTATIALDYGVNGGTVNQRFLKHSATKKLLAYQLYQDAAHSRVWGSDSLAKTVSAFPSTTQTYSVYGELLSSYFPPAGVYRDTVTVTVTY